MGGASVPRDRRGRLSAADPPAPARLEPLEARQLLDGSGPLYVIAPGEEGASGLPNWVYDMALAISQRNNLGCEESGLLASRVRHDAADLSPDGACSDFLLFDWSGASGTAGIANDDSVGGALASAVRQRLPSGGTLDVHFIGHGRGAYVVSDAVRRLKSESKVGFIQLTALDPVYRGSDGSLSGPGDAEWVERYYQTGGIPAGSTRAGSIAGALNIDLTGATDRWSGRGGSNAAHHEVHDWYHWTIDTDDASYVGYRDSQLNSQQTQLASNPGAIRSDLYEELNLDLDLNGQKDIVARGEAAGFHWSRSQALAPEFPFYHSGLDLVLVIDVSGSMGPDMNKVSQAVSELLDQMHACFGGNVRVGIVGYSEATRTVLPMTTDRAQVMSALAGLATDGLDPELPYLGVRHALDMKGGLGGWRGGTVQRAIIVLADEHPQDALNGYHRHNAAVHAYGTGSRPNPVSIFTVLYDDYPEARRGFAAMAAVARGRLIVPSNAQQVADAVRQGICGTRLTLPTISVTTYRRPQVEGSRSRPRTIVFTVTLGAPAAGRLAVDYTTVNSTARAGADYVATSGTLIFERGERSKRIAVRLVGDWRPESTESFTLKLNAVYRTQSITAERDGRIADDDERAADLAYDAQGNLHQIYYDRGRLFHAVRSPGGSWSDAQRVERRKGRYQFISMAIAPTGAPAVAYYDGYRSLLKYAQWNGREWKVSLVDRTGNAGLYASLAFDARGRGAISYFDTVGRNLKLALQRGKSWTHRFLARRGNVGWETDLALNPRTNELAIAFVDRTRGAVMYGEQTRTGRWVFSQVDQLSRRNGDLSLAFDPESRWPALSYYDAKQRDLLFAQYNGRRWVREQVATAGDQGSDNHLFFQDNGTAQILFYSASHRSVFLAEKQGSSWSRSQLRSDVGRLFAIAGLESRASDFLWLKGSTEQFLVDELA